MAKNKKPAKKYRPKHPPGQIVLPKNIRYGQREETMLMLVPHNELEKLRDGTADEGTWHTITMRLDWGCFLSIDHFQNIEVNDHIRDALNAMLSIKDRNARTGKWGASGDEFFKIGEALNLIDEMQRNTTRREQDESLNAMLRLNNLLLKEQHAGSKTSV